MQRRSFLVRSVVALALTATRPPSLARAAVVRRVVRLRAWGATPGGCRDARGRRSMHAGYTRDDALVRFATSSYQSANAS